jgi:hypothetical protein
MTQVKNGMLIICPEPEDRCELCGKIAELRPYGPNGERICFECGMLDEETTKKKFKETMLDKVVPTNPDHN